MNLIEAFLQKATTATTIENTKAYVDTALMVYTESHLVNVMLKGTTAGKFIEVIKIVRNKFKHGLKESKDIVEAANITPQLLCRVSVAEAETLRREIEAVGGLIDIR